jgi:hypothetical protein
MSDLLPTMTTSITQAPYLQTCRTSPRSSRVAAGAGHPFVTAGPPVAGEWAPVDALGMFSNY